MTEVLATTARRRHKRLKVLTLKLDVLDQASAYKAAKEVERVFGGLNILVNTAGWLETATIIVDAHLESGATPCQSISEAHTYQPTLFCQCCTRAA